MRHRVQGRKLGLPSDQRVSLLNNQVRQLFEHMAIQTTETRAKEVRRIAERLITTARRNDLHSRRMVRRIIGTNSPGRQSPNYNPRGVHAEDLVKKLFDTIVPQVQDRPGGYTRILKIGQRRGDAAPIVKLEIVVD
jgi:large subunit ribosomal protein L17